MSASSSSLASYYRRGDRLEFHSEVVEVASGKTLTNVATVSGPASDPRIAIDSVRMRVMGALATRLSDVIGWELPPTAQPPTYEASQAYARGMEAWARSDYRAAAQAWERAYALDTTYLRSLMLAAAASEGATMDSLLHIVMQRQDELAPYDRYRLEYLLAGRRGDEVGALAAARNGVALVPYGTLRYALIGALVVVNRPHEALANLEDLHAQAPIADEWAYVWQARTEILHMLGQHERELQVARAARDTVAGQLFGMTYEGRALAALGRMDDLMSLVEEIVVAPPQPGPAPGSVLLELAQEARAHRHPEASLQIAKRALAWLDGQPQAFKASTAARGLRGRLLYAHRDWKQAGAEFAALAVGSSDDAAAVGFQGTSAAHLGDVDRAQAFALQLAALPSPQSRGAITVWRARIAAALGRREEAVSLLRQAFSEGLAHGIWLHCDADFLSLHGYGPFDELMEPSG